MLIRKKDETDTNPVGHFSYLEMTKTTTDGLYDDGFVYLFDKENLNKGFTPKHISYWIQTDADSADMESCDFRLTTYAMHTAPPKEDKKPLYDVVKSPLGPPGYDR